MVRYLTLKFCFMRGLFFILCSFPFLLTAQENLPWQPFSFGTPVLSMQIPGLPARQNTNLTPDVKAFVKAYDAYYHQNADKGIVITMMHAFYENDVQADKMGAVEGTNNQWEATGSRVVISSTTENTISSRSAVQQSGILFSAGREYDFMDVVIVEGARIWQIIVMVASDDESLQPVLRKVINSVEFK